MGSNPQERRTAPCVERDPNRNRDKDRDGRWRRRAGRSCGRPSPTRSKMGRRQSQPPCAPQRQHGAIDNAQKPQQRRRTKHTTTSRGQQRAHSGARSSRSPSGDRAEPRVHQPRPHLPDRDPCPPASDSDTDLSESERRPLPPSAGRTPPQLHLRPEVMEATAEEEGPSCRTGPPLARLHFPDFLPPPFNWWNLRQLAVFYGTEGRSQAAPRSSGPLERYLERLLQLEWHQMQTVQEESGRRSLCEALPSLRGGTGSACSRLSAPKSILQCQRAFPFTFLSSLASHSTLLSGCSCHSRPLLLWLPRRSRSESRGGPGDRSHLRRMQASGNIRHPEQAAASRGRGGEVSGAQTEVAGCRAGSTGRSQSQQRNTNRTFQKVSRAVDCKEELSTGGGRGVELEKRRNGRRGGAQTEDKEPRMNTGGRGEKKVQQVKAVRGCSRTRAAW